MIRKWIIAGVFVAVTIIAVVIALMANAESDSPEFGRYKQYARDVNVTDWTISEETAKDFSEANCDKLANGDMPSIKFMNEGHVKSSAAVLAAYCPDSFDNFLAGVIAKYPEYKKTALYVNERLEVDSH